MLVTAAPTVLAEAEWTAREAAHHRRMDTWVVPHQERRRTGTAHPVLDFLFTYYSETPGRLRRWHPGAGTVLIGEAARDRLTWPLYTEVDVRTGDGDVVRGVGLDRPAFLAKRRAAAGWVEGLLSATAGRAGQFGCFGMHEWAMLYRPEDGEVRHALPLRLGQAGTDAVVEAHRVQCSHIDAFRFFTRAGVPRNNLQPTRETQQQLEQPGCLHATMDLYKWAYKLSPATPGELLADCFALAADVRELDMRASPYDLSGHGYAPVAVETPEGKAAYVAAQRGFAARGAVLRQRLLAVCRDLLDEG
ncbi:3-methyladenine DNA glycosylase [Modestobacter sp. SSW1-42]|uniref:3-methyladenine DNA glycosylase n=1 Tax=Modestobacter sp. SSW1-42 TaxID=596372 RepID=UPI003985B2B6